MSSSTPKVHVVVLPFPFGGHALVLFNLIQKLATKAPSVHFSFINTRESNCSLCHTGSHALSLLPNIRVYDAGVGKSPEHFLESAKTSYESAIRLTERESSLKVSCLLTDVFMLFAWEIARDMNVDWIPFWTSASYALASFLYEDIISDISRENKSKPDRRIQLTAVLGLSAMYLEDLPNEDLLAHDDSLMSAMFRSIRDVVPRATVLLLNSFEEMSPEDLVRAWKSKFKHLLHIGCQTVSFQQPSTGVEPEDETGCLSWLNEQEPKTVAYISFGTIASISAEDISAVAAALEETGTPFLWSLKEQFCAHFPPGFQERTSRQGKVVSWAPQNLVLGHTACGVFVTHCGYNSVFESIAAEVPMLCRPLMADHMMNGRMVEDVWRIGMKVDQVNGRITAEGMAKCLRMVLGGGEEGRMMRERISVLREKLAAASAEEGSTDKDLRSLVEIITSYD
ncbi:hypothetical protein MLD38_006595 [Melastoma candidum]|uniref:Uncharacterized protein n=1 Tax=Melastoma candidum TaxID=119954 RepID=A0ACB9RND8_9MYRT|nr:hypothetical protein MLD38_006595 [Melastoma candidum]